MHNERDDIIESIRLRLRAHRELLLRRLGGHWPDEAELSNVVTELASEVPALQELQRTELALQRIRVGTYGTCRECRQNIAGERLEVVPFTQICVPCQLKGIQPSDESSLRQGH